MNSKKLVNRSSGRAHGEVFTAPAIVNYLLDEVGYRKDKDLQKLKILEPSAGIGAFAIEIVHRLYNSSVKFSFPFLETLAQNIRLVELNENSYKNLVSRIDCTVSALLGVNVEIGSKITVNGDFLTTRFDRAFECVVGNPPYIRHELIPEEKKEKYKSSFHTFKYRADLYIPFYEKALRLLTKEGYLSFVCSNRWLSNQYGEPLRNLIASQFNLIKVLNIERAELFDESVIAYPSITTIKNASPSTEFLYCESSAKKVALDELSFKLVPSPQNGSWQNIFVQYDLDHEALSGIVEQGFEIGIGVATGSDAIFIKDKANINGIERSRLLPLIMARDLRDNQLRWSEKYLVNPYEGESLCSLEKYPHLKEYFESHKQALVKRHTAKDAPEKWYKTIDKVKPGLLAKPKILLPDLSGNSVLIVDGGSYYPHHNIYYITGKEKEQLEILAAILMSDFTKDQLSKIGIKMNGGLPRLQAQVLKKLKIPLVASFSSAQRAELLNGYHSRDFFKINSVIAKYCAEKVIFRDFIPRRKASRFTQQTISF
jgi:adenine-specific DNA-methyltransferase